MGIGLNLLSDFFIFRIKNSNMFKLIEQIIFRPSRKQVIIYSFVWLLVIALLVVVATDFFATNFLQKKYLGTHFIIFFSFLSVVIIWLQYKKTSSKSDL